MVSVSPYPMEPSPPHSSGSSTTNTAGAPVKRRPVKQQPVKFKDALGRKFSFPFHLCKTWKGIESLIQQAFLHVDIIGPYVDQGAYDLIGPNKEIILPGVWETYIKPGWVVTMRMWHVPESEDTNPRMESTTKSGTSLRTASPPKMREVVRPSFDFLRLDHHDQSTVVHWSTGSILRGDVSVGDIRNHIASTLSGQNQKVKLIFEKQLLLNDTTNAVDVGIKRGSRITYVIEEDNQGSESSEDEAALPFDLSTAKTKDSGRHKFQSMAAECLGCDNQFMDLIISIEQATNSVSITSGQIQDEFDRFRIWSGNMSAKQRAASRISLDWRLRDASNLKREILALLRQISMALSDISEIVMQQRQDRSKTVFADEQSSVTITESEELLKLISSTISSLFRMSLLIQKATPRDRFLKANTAVKRPMDPAYDILHVAAKLPKLKQEGLEWLQDKLGNAITQQRQYFRYSRKHREQKSQLANEERTIDGWSGLSPQVNAKQPFKVLNTQTESSFAPTSASTLQPDQLVTVRLSGAEHEDDTVSQTSFATSLGGEESEDCLKVPLLEQVSRKAREFECPYCYMIVSPKSQKHWKKHVFADLRPYVCQYKDCDVKLFSDRQAWFDHEVSAHRSTYKCLFCSHQPFSNESALELHLTKQHGNLCPSSGISSLVKACAQIPQSFSSTACVLCYEWAEELRKLNSHIPKSEDIFVTAKQFRNHVAFHMEQLALFALPRHLADDSDGDVESRGVALSSKVKSLPDINDEPESTRTHSDYTVGWICRPGDETSVATLMLGERHSPLPQPASDHNVYILGRISEHNVVIWSCERYDSFSREAEFEKTFSHLRFSMFVGIGGGVPTQTDTGSIKLGDTVVGMPKNGHSGTLIDDSSPRIPIGSNPDEFLLDVVRRLAATRNALNMDPLQTLVESKNISFTASDGWRYEYPGIYEDHLHEADYIHKDISQSCQACGCDAKKRVIRKAGSDKDDTKGLAGNSDRLTVHYGTIMPTIRRPQSGEERDRLALEDTLCVDEGFLIMTPSFPCLFIRGISDYADGHKNKRWTGYACLVAAGYARELLNYIRDEEVIALPPILHGPRERRLDFI